MWRLANKQIELTKFITDVGKKKALIVSEHPQKIFTVLLIAQPQGPLHVACHMNSISRNRATCQPWPFKGAAS